jgi:hypothetical protein
MLKSRSVVSSQAASKITNMPETTLLAVADTDW